MDNISVVLQSEKYKVFLKGSVFRKECRISKVCLKLDLHTRHVSCFDCLSI